MNESSLIESGLDLSSVSDSEGIAFPRLDVDQVAQVVEIAKARTLQDGDLLWDVGDRHASFFVIQEGCVAITQPTAGGEQRVIVKHGAGGFTGDIDLLSSKAAVVAGRAVGTTRVLEVCPQTLKKIVVASPTLSDIILAAFIARRRLLLADRQGEITLIGSRYSPQLYALREFLERNSRPFSWIDVEGDTAAERLTEGFDLKLEELPAVVTATGEVCRNPSVAALAAELGLSDIGDDVIYDMAVVGGGPAGLAAAVYGGSEGLKTIVLDSHAPGGQAATSSKIENYLGFPMGISGAELANNALVQAEKFGVRFATPRRVAAVEKDGAIYSLILGDGERLRARTLVAASGVQYRRLPAANTEQFEGRGIYYAATRMEYELCKASEIAIVGGGNSAGQAAVFLANSAKSVHIIIRSGDLDHSMSRYLIDRIDELPNVHLLTHTEIERFDGSGRLSSILVRDNRSGVRKTLPVLHVFVFVGAVANTDWLKGFVEMDNNGFVQTGESIDAATLSSEDWSNDDRPSAFETGARGIFAIGDVRRGSTKRVASAVGEGSVVVQFVHRRVAEHGPVGATV